MWMWRRAAAADYSSRDGTSEMSDVVDANVVFVQKHSPEQRGCSRKQNKKKRKKRKQNKQCMEASRILPNVCAAHQQTQRGRPKLLPAASRSPLRAPPSRWWCEGRPLFCVYHQPFSSRVFQEEELRQGRGHGGAVSTPPWGQESRAPP